MLEDSKNEDYLGYNFCFNIIPFCSFILDMSYIFGDYNLNSYKNDYFPYFKVTFSVTKFPIIGYNQTQILPHITVLCFILMENLQVQYISKIKQFISLKCPFGCSHHTFPNHFNFCPFCGSKLEDFQNELR